MPTPNVLVLPRLEGLAVFSSPLDSPPSSDAPLREAVTASLDALGLLFLDILSLVLVGAVSRDSSSALLLETVAINLADLDTTGFFFLETSRRVLPPVSTLPML